MYKLRTTYLQTLLSSLSIKCDNGRRWSITSANH